VRADFVFMGIRINIASRNRRRWLVVGIFAGFAALVIAWFVFQGKPMYGLVVFFAFVMLSRFLGGSDYKGGLLPSFVGGDEREVNRRYRANYVAYTYLDFAFLPAFMAAVWKASPHNMALIPGLHIFFDQLPYALLIAGWVLYYTFPQAILLWTEPDMEETP